MWSKIKRAFHIHDWKYKDSEWYTSNWRYREECCCGEIREHYRSKSQYELLCDISRKLDKK